MSTGNPDHPASLVPSNIEQEVTALLGILRKPQPSDISPPAEELSDFDGQRLISKGYMKPRNLGDQIACFVWGLTLCFLNKKTRQIHLIATLSVCF